MCDIALSLFGSVSIVRRSDSPTAYPSLSTGKCIQQDSNNSSLQHVHWEFAQDNSVN